MRFFDQPFSITGPIYIQSRCINGEIKNEQDFIYDEDTTKVRPIDLKRLEWILPDDTLMFVQQFLEDPLSYEIRFSKMISLAKPTIPPTPFSSRSSHIVSTSIFSYGGFYAGRFNILDCFLGIPQEDALVYQSSMLIRYGNRFLGIPQEDALVFNRNSVPIRYTGTASFTIVREGDSAIHKRINRLNKFKANVVIARYAKKFSKKDRLYQAMFGYTILLLEMPSVIKCTDPIQPKFQTFRIWQIL